MAVFIRLNMRNGKPIFLRPEMVKAIYEVHQGAWIGSNIVIDGHDYDVEGLPFDIMRRAQFDIEEEVP